jgi:hypothetical protein
MAQEGFEPTRDLVKAIHEFDAGSLVREGDLGATFNFAAAVSPATKLINLFRSIPLKVLEDMPPGNLTTIRQVAEQVVSQFKRILDFSFDKVQNPAQARTQYIAELTSFYDGNAFPTLLPYIGYAAARTSDFGRLETEAREAIAAIEKQTAALQQELRDGAKDAQKMLEDIRAVAAEQGVSQEAIYFGREADRHETESKTWRTATIWLAIALGLYAFLTMFSNNIPGLHPADAAESSQIIAGKVLFFVVLAYMLLLSARNFLSHVHNKIVNRHRQNALLTYNALVNAGGTTATKDVVLGYAASCIYAPQETGYAKGIANETTLPQALIAMVTKNESK